MVTLDLTGRQPQYVRWKKGFGNFCVQTLRVCRLGTSLVHCCIIDKVAFVSQYKSEKQNTALPFSN